MDVSGWTIDQRMRLPDWCFGQRQITSAYQWNNAPGTRKWEIGTLALPDPCCIWSLEINTSVSTNGTGNLRVGLAAAVPISQAQMDAVLEIFPHYGIPMPGPNQIALNSGEPVSYSIPVRMGIWTDRCYLVIECGCTIAKFRVEAALVVSGLPTSMAGWLAHNK